MATELVAKIMAEPTHRLHPYPCPRTGCNTVCLGYSAFFAHTKICQLPRKPEVK
jgi:hypothetical protein